MFTVLAVLVVLLCTASLSAIIVRGKDVLSVYWWTRTHGTHTERALADFDLIRLFGTTLGVLGVAFLFIARLDPPTRVAGGPFRLASDCCLILSVSVVISATIRLRRAYRVQEREVVYLRETAE